VSEPRFVDQVRALMRERLLDATGELVVDRGWGAVTMNAVATRVGVSRQTVYNEFGDKSGLGAALVMRELEGFLTLVTGELGQRRQLVAALGGAVEAVMRAAQDNPLLKDVLVSAHGGQASLLPWLTTESSQLIDRAVAVVQAAVEDRPELAAFSAAETGRLVQVVVRLVLSHVVQPTVPPEQVSAEVGWVVDRIVAAGPARTRRR
jgi:AcrR family transcriptional regulator